ncbi:MAG TPA: hypothetical protein VGK89_09010 [Candidatus Eisenbacteria bacterium]|jgi:hypothetical protein
MIRATLVLAILFAACAAPARAHPGQSLDLTAGIETYFDDNTLNYSAHQLEDLASGRHPYRFGVGSPGDLVFKPALGLLWQSDRDSDRRRALGASAAGEMYGRSVVANSGEYGVLWREGFRIGRLSLAYRRSPQEYLRRLSDADLAFLPSSQRYRDVAVDLHRVSAAWRQAVPRLSWIDLGYTFERRRYPGAFRERDSDLHRGTLAVGWERMPRGGRLALSAGLRKLDARAEDGDEPPGAVPDEPDLSDHALLLGASGGLDLGVAAGLGIAGEVEYDLESRGYDSDRPADDSHFGRQDLIQAVELALRIRSEGPWSARAFYRAQHNRARYGSTDTQESEIGGYRANQAGLALEWRRQVGSRGRPKGR